MEKFLVLLKIYLSVQQKVGGPDVTVCLPGTEGCLGLGFLSFRTGRVLGKLQGGGHPGDLFQFNGGLLSASWSACNYFSEGLETHLRGCFLCSHYIAGHCSRRFIPAISLSPTLFPQS